MEDNDGSRQPLSRFESFYGLEDEEMKKSQLQSLRNLKQNLIPLGSGNFGVVGRTPDGSRVIKYGAGLEYEYKVLTHLQALAPQYFPLPVALRRFPNVPHQYALEMMNAGPTVYELGVGITKWEKTLCQLQWIHCLLLCGGRVLIKDQSSTNMCVRWRGVGIELRFIDVGLWQLPLWNGGDTTISLGYTVEDARHAPMRVLQNNIKMMRVYSTFVKQYEKTSALWLNAASAEDLVNLAAMLCVPRGNQSYADATVYYACRDRLNTLLHDIQKAAVKCQIQLAHDGEFCVKSFHKD